MALRINKFLSRIGYCSRRQADDLLAAGRIYVRGKAAKTGDVLEEGDTLYIDGKYIAAYEDANRVKAIILALYKPRGIVCTSSTGDRAPNIVDYVHYPERVYPVGRLDKDSEGLILLTNQGDMVNALMRAGNYHEKEYEVEVDRDISEDFLRKMAAGVYLPQLQQKTRKCKVVKLGKRSFRIVLTQGLNRQIRRMCAELGMQVKRLKRIRIMHIRLEDLAYGAYRELDTAEIKDLYRGLGLDKKEEGHG